MASLSRNLGGKQFISAAVRGGVKMVSIFILNFLSSFKILFTRAMHLLLHFCFISRYLLCREHQKSLQEAWRVVQDR
jgi:hypothetical protein